MNERIKQLLTPKLKEWGGDLLGGNFSEELEKFAELIVRDVVEQIITRERTDGEWYQYDIFKHFGVEK